MDAERLFRDFDIHLAQAVRDYRARVDAINDARLARGHVRPAHRWYQQRDTLFLIAASLFTAGTMASAVMAWGL